MTPAANVSTAIRVDTIDDVSPHPKTRKNPRGAGRSALRAGEASSIVGLRLADTDRARYQAAADSAEQTLSDWIRAACEAHVGARSTAPPKKVRR